MFQRVGPLSHFNSMPQAGRRALRQFGFGQITIAAGSASQTKAFPYPVVVGNTIVGWTGCRAQKNSQSDGTINTGSVQLSSATLMIAGRGYGVTGGTSPLSVYSTDVSYFFFEFDPGVIKSIQQFSVDITTATGTATLSTPVVVANSVIIPQGFQLAVATALLDGWVSEPVLTNTTTVTVDAGSNRGYSGAYFGVVVEFFPDAGGF